MINVNHLTYRCRRVPRPALALLAGALLLGAAPVGAGWLGRGIGVAGVGKSVTETLTENTGIVGEMVGAFIDGDDEKVSELMGEVKKTPGKLIKRAFPVLEAPLAIANRLKSAKQKIARFTGGVREGFTDARAALAVDRDRQDGGWSDAALLEGEPLPAPPETAFTATKYRYESPAEVLTALKGEAVRESGAAGDKPAASSWDFDEWVVAKQEAKPHCYGVVDPETLPADCFGAAAAEEPAAPPAVNQVEDSSSGASGDEYDAALAGVLGDGSASAATDDDYLAALNDLETKEAERRREEEETCDKGQDMYLDDSLTLTGTPFSSVDEIDPNKVLGKLWSGGDYRNINGLFQVCLYDSVVWAQKSLPIARKNVTRLDIEGSENWQDKLDEWKKKVHILEDIERGEGLVLKISGSGGSSSSDQVPQCKKYYARLSSEDLLDCDCFTDWSDSMSWLNETIKVHTNSSGVTNTDCPGK